MNGYFKTLWLANDKWRLKCILHNECGYFKTLWFANDKWGVSVFCIMNVDISIHYDFKWYMTV